MHLITDCAGSPAAARISRSKEVRGVGEVLRGYVPRGVFHDLTESNMRLGRVVFRMLWHNQCICRFVFDLEASELSFPALLPGVTEHSSHLRKLKAFLRSHPAQEPPEYRRIDPRKGALWSVVRHGALTLGMAVRNGEYEYCTHRMVQLADEVLDAFTGRKR